ncbi:MAG: hypothetical protein ACTSVW_06100 [Candidatus Njordarchaeales archaeon]
MEFKRVSPVLIMALGFTNLLYGVHVFQNFFDFSFSILLISIGGILTSGGIVGLLEGWEYLKRLKISSKSVKYSFLLIILALIIIQTTIVAGILSSSIRISSVGVINVGVVKTVGVKAYLDSECTQEVSSIDWGVLEPGSTKSFTIFIKNEGNVDVTLSLSSENWTPQSASTYITISWDYNGSSIAPNQVIQVNLNLQVSSSVSGIDNFSFDIVITATEST